MGHGVTYGRGIDNREADEERGAGGKDMSTHPVKSPLNSEQNLTVETKKRTRPHYSRECGGFAKKSDASKKDSNDLRGMVTHVMCVPLTASCVRGSHMCG